MATKINILFKNIADTFRNLPRRYYLLGAFLLGVVLVAALFWPQQVLFSYANNTCFYQPTLAPGLLGSRSEAFRLEADQQLTVGSIPVAALRTCIVPLKAPEQGTATASLSLAGVPWLQKTYTITTPPAPAVSMSTLAKRPVSVSQQVRIPLSAPDVVFAYSLQAGTQKVACDVKQQQLVCDMAKLSLKQGSKYELTLHRYFHDRHVAMVAKQPVTTLTATTITTVSITDGQVVYAKPKTIELTADKAITDGSVVLEKIDGDKRTRVPVRLTYGGLKATVSWDDELVRQAKFVLTVDKLTGSDGSGLDGAYKVTFETSGGPKVKSVNVGSYKVPMGATVAITFDQPILSSQDLAKTITATGGAVVTGTNGAQVFVSFAGVPRCGDVVITVSDALQSEHGVIGGSAWRYATRTLCQIQSTIGNSAKGRAMTAYSFGSGANTIVYTGAIHGNEVSTRSLMLRWIDELEANAKSIPADKAVVVIPVINLDGYAAGARTNANNVDLNRNFATADWRSDITTTSNASFPGGGGKSAMSEPETRAIANYISRVRPRLVLSYHSIGGLLASNQVGDASARAATYARVSGYRNTTGASDTFEYGISGTADDYYGEVLGVPSLLIELGSHTDPQFARNRDAMWAMIR